MKFLKLLVAALSPVCALSASVLQSNNVELQVEDAPIRTQEGWDWRDCGTYSSIISGPISISYVPRIGDTSDPLQIKSIEVFPDPPKPGQDMTVKVKAYAQELIEVCIRHFLSQN